MRIITACANAHSRSLGIAVALVMVTCCGQNAAPSDQVGGGSSVAIGMSTALRGPAAKLGQNVQSGVLAAFQEANAAGGVRGRMLKLTTLDDGYEPSQTAPNMRQLIEQHEVVAVIGNVGTPTAVAAIPIANSMKVPFFGAYTGAGILRKSPPDRYVINYRASYQEETAAMVRALLEHAGLKPKEIAFFTQRDGYGDAGFDGGVAALKCYGFHDSHSIAHGRYERNTMQVEKGLAEILMHREAPKAVIMVGAYAPCAKFIKKAKAIGFAPIFLNVSFVGSDSLATTLGAVGDGVIVTQVVPHPDSESLLAENYRAALRQLDQAMSPSHGSFEGYIAARILTNALSTIEGSPTRESIVDALEGLGHFTVDSLGSLKLSATEHQASHSIWPTMLSDGKVVPIQWDQLSRKVGGPSQ